MRPGANENKPFGLSVNDAEVHGLMHYLVEDKGFALAQQTLAEFAEFLGGEDFIEVLVDCENVFHRLCLLSWLPYNMIIRFIACPVKPNLVLLAIQSVWSRVEA